MPNIARVQSLVVIDRVNALSFSCPFSGVTQSESCRSSHIPLSSYVAVGEVLRFMPRSRFIYPFVAPSNRSHCRVFRMSPFLLEKLQIC